VGEQSFAPPFLKERKEEVSMDNTLWKIFDTIDSLVKYAESKNIHILTFLGLQLTVVRVINIHVNLWFDLCAVFLGASVFLSVVSFLPKSRLTNWLYHINRINAEPHVNDNMLYYGDIVKYTVDGYIDVVERGLACKIKGNGYLENLCKQIVVNSGIANDKFRLFKLSFSLMLIGELCFAISLFSKL
jgi:hypothetical protein